jgi:hypothetical protein
MKEMPVISEGYISSGSINIYDECWDMIEYLQDDLSDLFSDADPGL